ncbi:Amino Acid-Polyamine-Organocation (APC) Family [Phytophthora palmivora]|uniref:Amino Acid-Polyamine-Organocation (APC) Family n=1 Tax=Phytophthora palmivora TaxID=4796 RepID=A0A2P4WWN6_9STRA|nr:Amino Acid-Polyamine-Organocation (APC) Family [Phytophthora palmivora]
MTIYVGVSLVVTGMAPIDILGSDVPLVNAFTFHDAPWAGRIVSFGSIFGLTTAAFTCLMGQPRIFYQMAKDGLLPSLFAKLHHRTHVPVSSTIFTGVLVASIAFVFDLDFLANVISCGTLQVFTFVNAGVLLLRMRPSLSGAGVVHRVLLFVISCFALSLSFVFDLPWTIQGVLAAMMVASFVFIYRLGKLGGAGVVHRVLLFVISCFALSLSFVFDLPWTVQGMLAAMMVASFVFIYRLGKLGDLTTSFQCPLVPFVPCMGILANVYMVASIPGEGWIGVLIWLGAGLFKSMMERHSSVEYLLPFQSSRPGECEEDDENPANSDDESSVESSSKTRESNDKMLELYRQAVPLVQPQSTAAIRTLGAIVHDRELVKRMLQRPQPYAKQLDRRPQNRVSPASRCASLSALPPSALPLSSDSALENAQQSTGSRRLAFMAACEKLLMTFDPQVQQTRRIKLMQIKPLLRFHGLEVADAAFRRWEQRLSSFALSDSMATTGQTISVSEFITGCQLWFTETFLIDHVQNLSTWQKQQCAMKAGKGKHNKLLPLQYDHRQSPAHAHQPPFDQLAHQSDATSTFSYEAYARNPPPRVPSLNASASAPALLHARYCSHNKPDPITLAAVTKLKTAKVQERRKKKEVEVLVRQAKQQNTEMARAFAASVAMISRHVHNEEMRDHRVSELDKQIARTDLTRHWNQLHKAHCQAIEEDARAQRTREVCAMKALAKEELHLSRDFRTLREEVVRRNKPLFTLSSSTKTVFPAPPEILAARATASTDEDHRRLARVEREHNEHMRSLQLLDYAYDRKRMMADALQPRADSALVEVDVADEELPADRVLQLAGDELWRQLVQRQLDGDPDSIALFVPPSNAPPAALRYFGISRPVSMPAFASTVDRNLQ